jgi:hypothetical protein
MTSKQDDAQKAKTPSSIQPIGQAAKTSGPRGKPCGTESAKSGPAKASGLLRSEEASTKGRKAGMRLSKKQTPPRRTLTVTLTGPQLEALTAAARSTGVDEITYARSVLVDVLRGVAAKPKKGACAVLVEHIRGLSGKYGDPTVAATDLARNLREEAESGR